MVAGAIGGHSDLGEGSGGRPHSVLGLRGGERLHVVWHDATSKWLYGVMEGGPALYRVGCHPELFGSPPILAKSTLKSKLVPKVDTFCNYCFFVIFVDPPKYCPQRGTFTKSWPAGRGNVLVECLDVKT